MRLCIARSEWPFAPKQGRENDWNTDESCRFPSSFSIWLRASPTCKLTHTGIILVGRQQRKDICRIENEGQSITQQTLLLATGNNTEGGVFSDAYCCAEWINAGCLLFNAPQAPQQILLCLFLVIWKRRKCSMIMMVLVYVNSLDFDCNWPRQT